MKSARLRFWILVSILFHLIFYIKFPDLRVPLKKNLPLEVVYEEKVAPVPTGGGTARGSKGSKKLFKELHQRYDFSKWTRQSTHSSDLDTYDQRPLQDNPEAEWGSGSSSFGRIKKEFGAG